jgi:hypothetical protein
MRERRGEHSEESSSDEDDELDALLRLNSESDGDDMSNEESAPTGSSSKGKKSRRKRGRGGAYDGPASLVAVLVVGCWTMRLGKLYTDFVRYGLGDGWGLERKLTNGV